MCWQTWVLCASGRCVAVWLHAPAPAPEPCAVRQQGMWDQVDVNLLPHMCSLNACGNCLRYGEFPCAWCASAPRVRHHAGTQPDAARPAGTKFCSSSSAWWGCGSRAVCTLTVRSRTRRATGSCSPATAAAFAQPSASSVMLENPFFRGVERMST